MVKSSATKWTFIISIGFSFLFGLHAHAEFENSPIKPRSTPECFSKTWEGGPRGEYCVAAPVGGSKKSDTLLVFFHGLGGNKMNWFQWEPIHQVHEQLIAKGEDPWIISISFGLYWLMSEVPNSKQLYTRVLNEIIPEAEAKITSAITSRWLVGVSMGGFNAAQVLLKNPERFQKVALLCPAITQIGPYSTTEDLQDYSRRTGAQFTRILAVRQLVRGEFKTEEDWQSHAPLILADRASSLPSTYISCGLKDSYGFQEGAELLYNKLLPRSSDLSWFPIPDRGHCAIDAPSVTEFLLR